MGSNRQKNQTKANVFDASKGFEMSIQYLQYRVEDYHITSPNEVVGWLEKKERRNGWYCY